MLTDLIGRLHPALVHLPIGILLLAACFELLSSSKRFSSIRPAVPLMLFWGMLSAIAACISGIALESGGDYEEELTNPHKWSGISLAVISILTYFLYRKKTDGRYTKIASSLVIVMIFVTGHLGGSITHGEDYITAAFDESSQEVKMKPIPDIQAAAVYNDIVQPLFEARCYNCHSSRKQKGKLRLDEQDFIIKGGESGNTIIPGKPEESELIERLLLPSDHDDHMPPKGKPQLTKEQIEILEWWVNTGADFHKKVAEMEQPDKIRPALLALETGKGTSGEEMETDLPTELVAAADTSIIRKLNDAGVVVVPIARDMNYLSANFVTSTGSPDHLLQLLQSLKNQLVSLKFDGTPLKDSNMNKIASFTSLRKLQLRNTAISDESVQQLAALKELRSLNLMGTSITAKGLSYLKDHPNLKNIYLYKTSIDSSEQDELKKHFPTAKLDFGNYTLPMLATDTTEVKF